MNMTKLVQHTLSTESAGDRLMVADAVHHKAWAVFDQIREDDLLAADYLGFMACIGGANVPESLLPLMASKEQQTKALRTLTRREVITERLHKVQESSGDRRFDMPLPVHMASVRWLERHNQLKAWVKAAVVRLEALVPYVGNDKKEIWTQYLPHAIYVVGLQALSIRTKVLGPEHPQTLTSMNHVAAALNGQGEHSTAEAIHSLTLERRRKVLGLEHPNILASMNNLVAALSGQGEYATAEAIHSRTLELSKSVLGKKHSNTLMSMNNVANALSDQGKYAAAEAIHRQTLELRMEVLGERHPDTLMSMNNLGYTLSRQGNYALLEELNFQTLEPSEKDFVHSCESPFGGISLSERDIEDITKYQRFYAEE
ncbi:hypothetical protein E8E11_000233 [Didymella keratinophila]|nr:hypothetical protein E8E11_000233 [Didymella keratinophila]